MNRAAGKALSLQIFGEHLGEGGIVIDQQNVEGRRFMTPCDVL
jgi:hypothetical protein